MKRVFTVEAVSLRHAASGFGAIGDRDPDVPDFFIQKIEGRALFGGGWEITVTYGRD